MRSYAVSYGYHHRPPAELHADHVIHRFDDLLSLVIDPSPDSPIERRSKLDTSRVPTGV
jgi:hypothetical protein